MSDDDFGKKKKKKPQKHNKVQTSESNYGRRHWEIVEAPGTEEDLLKQQEITDKLNKAETLTNLQARQDKLNLDDKIGKKILVTNETSKEHQGGFYCKDCECQMKDSQAWLDHINGKKHNKLLGKSMRVERVTVDKIREKLLKLKKDNVKPNTTQIATAEVVEKKVEEELKKKEDEREHAIEVGKKKLKVENSEDNETQLSELDPEIANFDLPLSFNTSRRKH
jgi:U4/U6.U5 tri-snRNP component SNU23